MTACGRADQAWQEWTAIRPWGSISDNSSQVGGRVAKVGHFHLSDTKFMAPRPSSRGLPFCLAKPGDAPRLMRLRLGHTRSGDLRWGTRNLGGMACLLP